MAKKWTARDLPDLTGQTWLITGPTNGIGLEAAKMAAARGASLVLAARNLQRAEQLAEVLGGAEVIHLNLDSLACVREAAAQVGDIDVLINNAGLSTDRRETTHDGFERILGVNFLAPFHFTNLILPKVAKRIIILGSVAHQWGDINLDDPNFEHRRWTRRTAYAQSKLADMLWGYELARKLHTASSPVDVQIAHPGWAVTNLGTPAISQPWLERVVGALAIPFLGQSARAGALPTLYAASEPLPPGSYIGPNGPFQTRGYPTRCKRTTTAKDAKLAAQLWAYAEAALVDY